MCQPVLIKSPVFYYNKNEVINTGEWVQKSNITGQEIKVLSLNEIQILFLSHGNAFKYYCHNFYNENNCGKLHHTTKRNNMYIRG